MSRLLRVLALALVAALLLGACGDDSSDSESEDTTGQETPTEAASSEEFCTAVVDAETTVLAAQSGGDTSQLESLLATVKETKPEEIATEVDAVVAAVEEGMATQSDKAFGTDEFQSNDETVDQWVADNCGFENVEVSAVEYAFQGVPPTLPAGHTTFTFSNDGEELHEMIMFRFKDESASIDDLIKLSDKEAQKVLEFVGASFGEPGDTDTEAKTLEAGKYGLVCFVPLGATSEEDARKAKGPPHVTKGMSYEFTVE